MAEQNVEFNLQRYLEVMEANRRQDHADLLVRVNEGFAEAHATAVAVANDLRTHEDADLRVAGETNTRLKSLERVHSNFRWLAGVVLVTLLGVLGDLAMNYFAPKPVYATSSPGAAGQPR
jgi:hypothetical protein